MKPNMKNFDYFCLKAISNDFHRERLSDFYKCKNC